MVGEWREQPIGELAEIFDGPHATPAKTESGPIFLGISNLAQGRLHLGETEHLSERDYSRWTRRVEPRAGDVVFSYETRLGAAARVPPGIRCCLGRRMGLLRARTGKVDERFLLYAYLGPQFQEILRSRTIHGSTVDRIPLIDMPAFPIVVPCDLGEQRAIAHILGTLDDKIDLNRRLNETLEAIERALFQSWFVDFDPVRAKAEGRDPGLPKPLAELFPDRFEHSELGEVPAGWRIKRLGDLTTRLSRGVSPSYVENGGVRVLNQKCIRNGEVDVSKARRHDSSKRSIENQGLQKGDILINSTGVGTLGRVAQVLFVEEETIVDSHVTVVRAEGSEVSWLYLGIELRRRQSEIEALGEGSTGQTELSRSRLRDLEVIVPSSSVLAAFDKLILPVCERAAKSSKASIILAECRNTLLPSLVLGHLRVKDPTRFFAPDK